jgi:hypothetical protein
MGWRQVLATPAASRLGLPVLVLELAPGGGGVFDSVGREVAAVGGLVGEFVEEAAEDG